MATKQPKTMPAGHTSGIFADMSLDGPEIGTLVAVVDRAKNLPNRKTMGKQDPYCAMRLGKEAKKTETDRRGGQTPRWDQELRFTVHDSADYYKLKCSIFNDDKRTDLIGEAWIDLKDVIVPGGGQNDLWHQLKFKGKYAGDIRMEMTYYDTRVNQDTQQETRKHREKTRSGVSDSGSGSGLRHLGPREIKRRPLPPGPGQFEPDDMPAPLHIQPRYSQPPQQPETHAHPQSFQPPYQQQWMPPEATDPFGYEQPFQPQYNLHRATNLLHEDFRWPHTSHVELDNQSYVDQHDESFRPLYESQAPKSEIFPAQWHGLPYDSPPRSNPASSPHTSHCSTPPTRQSPPSIPQDSYRENRNNVSPTKYIPYRDSPLRQSISQQEVPLPYSTFQPVFEEGEAPPPPPAHRGSLPRPSLPISIQTAPHKHQSRQQPPRQNTIEDRSPLQMIEQQYSPHPPASARLPGRRISHLSQHDQFPEKSTSPPSGADEPIAGEFPAPHQLSINYGVDFVSDPVEQDRQGRYIRRTSAVESADFQRPPQPAQTFDTADVFDDRNIYRSEPHLVRPRAVSPNVGQTVPRKSVSPHPQSSSERSRISGTPFGPDSYDVLNPGSSAVSHGHSLPGQGEEVAEQKGVDTTRDQGPIIGNDGRIIDPSDHLPSDTWAPEPERKTRKPEHVIHVRRKNESQQSRAESSPAPTTPLSTSNSPYQSSPDPPSAPNSGRRQRLQKPMPQRPLPTQPYVHPHATPAAISQLKTSNQSSPSQQMSSTPSSPMSGPPLRPPLSEYQVPVSSDYKPRNSYHPHQHLATTPTRTPQLLQRPQSFAYGGYDDPLAAEMSMIDIGPSRGGGRTVLRSNRGYSGH